jgi:Ca2+-transporting ATPase
VVNALISLLVMALGILRGQPLVAVLRSAISLAVAAIPEGLPAVATTTLALGVRDMRRNHILVRRLDAVETLGAVEVVGLDKTGTLTQNHMAATAVHVAGKLAEVADLQRMGDRADASSTLARIARELFETAALCSQARIGLSGGTLVIDGTPTESALLEAALQLGTDIIELRAALPIRRAVLRGDGRKRMSTLHRRDDGSDLLCTKGDPVEVLACCSSVLTLDGTSVLDEPKRAEILGTNLAMAGRALRVLGIARSDDGGDPANETGLTWLGLAGLANPIRASVRPSLQSLHKAGIRTVMITGDQSATAFAIAKDLDLPDGGELKVLEAGQIRDLDPEILAALAREPQVFARVSPVDKLNIVRALQGRGHIVAMTGDGVNDGPALRAADIGIAMGAEGTDVAREVADIVLARDDLDGIVQALRLGRATHSNIRKVLRYLISTNASETAVMLGAALASGAAPLSPMQLLWLNLASDPLPALALGLEPPEPDILERPPRDPRAPILTVEDFRGILREAAAMGAATLAGYYASGGPGAGPRAATVAFHGLTASQMLHALASRSEAGLLGQVNRPANRPLWGAVGAAAVLQIGAQLTPGGVGCSA